MKLTPAERQALAAVGVTLKPIVTDTVIRIPVTTTLAGQPVYVTVARADLLAWCERRLETRATHKKTAVGSGGGLATFTLRTTV
jgi:hypothetical protein